MADPQHGSFGEETVFPQHIAIVMDGNGRWAKKRGKPRSYGHRHGVSTLRSIVEHCVRIGIPNLTVYAFSSENWQRPKSEVNFLMELFFSSLQRQIDYLNQNNILVNFIGDRSSFSNKLVSSIEDAISLTSDNDRLRLNIAANYGGRWDITRALRQLLERVCSGELAVEDITEQDVGKCLFLGELPEPDLFIRTGGERRISNYLLWQLAYTELYFTDCLWPDFNTGEFNAALSWFQGRERRFGKTSEQLLTI